MPVMSRLSLSVRLIVRVVLRTDLCSSFLVSGVLKPIKKPATLAAFGDDRSPTCDPANHARAKAR